MSSECTTLLAFLVAGTEGNVDGLVEGLASGLPVDALMSIDGRWYSEPSDPAAVAKLKTWFPPGARWVPR